MLMTKETKAGDPDAARLGDIRAAGSGAIRECEEHGWMQDRADPHARERAFDIARQDPPAGVSPDAAAAAGRATYWTRSATPAPNARPRLEGPAPRRSTPATASI